MRCEPFLSQPFHAMNCHPDPEKILVVAQNDFAPGCVIMTISTWKLLFILPSSVSVKASPSASQRWSPS